jgi:hypothetical protein
MIIATSRVLASKACESDSFFEDVEESDFHYIKVMFSELQWI